jgi:hypothetical protein
MVEKEKWKCVDWRKAQKNRPLQVKQRAEKLGTRIFYVVLTNAEREILGRRIFFVLTSAERRNIRTKDFFSLGKAAFDF